MAIASAGSLGSVANSAANQTSITLATGGTTLEQNNLVVVIVAVDNNATTDGDETAVSGVTAGVNTFTKAAEFTNSQGSAQAGATCSIWYCRIGTATTSDIVASFNNSTSRDKSAISAWEFTTGAAIAVAATNTLANDGADPGSLNATTANVSCLRVRGIASESNATTALTATSGSWTLLSQAVSTGGGSAANMGVRGEWIISTGTGDASDPALFNADHASVYAAFEEVSTNKTLAADAGSFSLTGTAATPKVARKVVADAGSYALTGSAATLRKNIPLVAGAGSYALTGTAATPLHKWSLAAAAESFTLTGTNAALSKGLTLAAGAGSFSLAGTAASLLHGWKLAAGGGSYALTGTDATLRRNLPLLAGAGSFNLTGTAASLLHGWKVTAAAGVYALTGSDATLTKTSALTLAADAGSFVLNGTAATLSQARTLIAGGGAYVLTGTAAALTHGGPPANNDQPPNLPMIVTMGRLKSF